MKKSGFKFFLAVAACGLLSTSANAAVSFTSVAYNAYGTSLPPAAAGQSLVTDFNTGILGNPVVAPGYTFTSSNAGLYNPPLVSGIAAPVPNDTTQYFAVLSGGQATLKSTAILSGLSVLLGSLDTYNTITFKNSDGVTVQSYTGSQLVPPPPPANSGANGDQFGELTNREFHFNFDASDKIAEVDFFSSGNSFEFDNIYAAAVPEPDVWLMMIAGFGLTGMMLRRRSGASILAV